MPRELGTGEPTAEIWTFTASHMKCFINICVRDRKVYSEYSELENGAMKIVIKCFELAV